MGLDMYAWAVPADIAKDAQVDFSPSEAQVTQKKELAYWRKFNHLHGWMERLYRHKGGKKGDFNCDSVRLNKEDLTALELVLECPAGSPGGLKATSGFFFGSENTNQVDIEKAKQFIVDAREAIEDGKAVFYDSWW